MSTEALVRGLRVELDEGGLRGSFLVRELWAGVGRCLGGRLVSTEVLVRQLRTGVGRCSGAVS